MLTEQETLQLISLLVKAAPRAEVAGTYKIIITPTIYAPDDFTPRKKVCIDEITNVVGETEVKVS